VWARHRAVYQPARAATALPGYRHDDLALAARSGGCVPGAGQACQERPELLVVAGDTRLGAPQDRTCSKQPDPTKGGGFVNATRLSTAICGWAELLPRGYGTVAHYSTGEGARSIRGPPASPHHLGWSRSWRQGRYDRMASVSGCRRSQSAERTIRSRQAAQWVATREIEPTPNSYGRRFTCVNPKDELRLTSSILAPAEATDREPHVPRRQAVSRP